MKAEDSHVREDKLARSISYFCEQLPVCVGPRLFAELKQIAEKTGRNARLCLHPGPDNLHHDMIICEHGENFGRPHKHLAQSETYHVIEGRLGVAIFDTQGIVTSTTALEPRNIYRIDVDVFHSVFPISKLALYHENKPGPFKRDEMIFAPWAPDGSDPKAAANYMETLKSRIGGRTREGSQ